MLLSGLNLIDQTGPDVVQHLDCTVGLSGVDIELREDQYLTPLFQLNTHFARLVLVI